MEIFKYRKYFFILIIIISGCTGSFNYSDFKMADFKNKNIIIEKKIKIKSQNCNDLAVGKHFLFVLSPESENCIKMYNKNNLNYIGDFCPIGNAPGNIQTPVDIKYLWGKIYVLDMGNVKISAFSIDISNKKIKHDYDINIDKQIGRIDKFDLVNENEIVISSSDSDKRLIAINKKGQIIWSCDFFPKQQISKALNNQQKSMLYLPNIDACGESGNILLSYLCADIMEIYKINSDEPPHKIHGPEKFSPKFKMHDKYALMMPFTKLAYFDAIINKKYIYSLYSGKISNQTKVYGTDLLLIFNNIGKPLFKSKLSNNYFKFCVDDSNDYIYMLTENAEIHKYRLNLSLKNTTSEE